MIFVWVLNLLTWYVFTALMIPSWGSVWRLLLIELERRINTGWESVGLVSVMLAYKICTIVIKLIRRGRSVSSCMTLCWGIIGFNTKCASVLLKNFFFLLLFSDYFGVLTLFWGHKSKSCVSLCLRAKAHSSSTLVKNQSVHRFLWCLSLIASWSRSLAFWFFTEDSACELGGLIHIWWITCAHLRDLGKRN